MVDLVAVLRQVVPDAYYVGGVVRDSLLKKPSGDIDLALPKERVKPAALALGKQLHAAVFEMDGEFGVWIECGEPRYVYNTFGLGHNHGGTGLFIEQHFNPNIPNTHYFSALERDRAIEAAVDAAMRRGDDQSVEGIRTCEEIEVLIPEAVKVNPMQQHGEGDPFLNSLNALTEGSDSVMEAGILAMAFTAKEIKKERSNS